MQQNRSGSVNPDELGLPDTWNDARLSLLRMRPIIPSINWQFSACYFSPERQKYSKKTHHAI
jgi:hypothetical protein